MGLGIYYIDNVVVDNPILKKLNVYHSGNAYPSPELEFMSNNGVTFDIKYGCWGSGFDMDFGDDYSSGMYEKEDDISHYCKWYGCLMKLNKKERFNFDCDDIEYAKLNQYANTDCDIRWNNNQSNGIIEYKKKYAYHSCHIASFISSYSRITVMNQLIKFKNLSRTEGK